MRCEGCASRQRALAIVVAIILPLSVGYLRSLSLAQTVEHTCSEIGIKLKLPHGWSPAKGNAQKGTCMFTKGKEAFLCLLAPRNESQWTAHSLLSNLVKGLKERNAGLDEIAPREVYPSDDGFIVVATLRRPPEGEAQIFVWAAAVKLGKRLIGAVCTSTPNIADTVKSEMLAALRSLREVDASKEIGVRLPLPEGELVISVEPKASEPCVAKPTRTTQPIKTAHHHALSTPKLGHIAVSPIAIEPRHSVGESKAPSALAHGEIVPDESGICKLPWLGMQIRLPSGWKIVPMQQVAPLSAPTGFCIVGEPIGEFVPTLSVNFVPTVVGLTLPKDATEAAKQIAQTFLSPFNWRQREKWQELISPNGRGVVSLFDITSTVGVPKVHAWVACMLFSGKQYAMLFVGTCQCDGDGKLHEVYRRIVMSISFEGGGR